jgi:hypothetical protein
MDRLIDVVVVVLTDDYVFSYQATISTNWWVLFPHSCANHKVIKNLHFGPYLCKYHAMVQPHKNQCLTCYSRDIAGGPNKHEICRQLRRILGLTKGDSLTHAFSSFNTHHSPFTSLLSQFILASIDLKDRDRWISSAYTRSACMCVYECVLASTHVMAQSRSSGVLSS